MRTFLVLFLVASMLVLAAPVAADAPEFPEFTPMAAGPEGVAVDNVGNVYVSVGIGGAHGGLEVRSHRCRRGAGESSRPCPGGVGS